MPRFRKILSPVVFDQNSLLALRLALELAQERQASLHLLHVVAMPPGPELALPLVKVDVAARGRLERMAKQRIGRKARYELEVIMGEPGVEILRAAKRIGVDLIVMATHARKGLRRLVLGSVTEYIVRESPCPVLTVNPKTARAKASRTPTRKKRHA